MADVAEAMMWAAVFAPNADEIAESIVRKEELRRSEDLLRKGKRDYLERSINGIKEINSSFFHTLLIDDTRTKIYPHISLEEEIQMIDRGEISVGYICYEDKIKNAPEALPNDGAIGIAFWTDTNREEAKHPLYIKRNKALKEKLLDNYKEVRWHVFDINDEPSLWKRYI